MKLSVLFGHRKQTFPGEFGLEALAVADDLTQEQNPDYLIGELEKYQSDKSFAALQVIDIKVNEGKIWEILYPKNTLEGEIV